MPIPTNSAWNTKNAGRAKTPVYVFAIGGQATVYATHDLTRVGITGTLPAYEAWLKVPQGASQSIDVQGATSSIGELECEVIDKGGAMRSLVGSTTLEGQSATLLVGYPGLAYSQFVTLHNYTIYKVIPTSDYTSYLFRSRDAQMDAQATVWTNPLNGYPLSAANPWIIQGTPCEIIQAVWLLGLSRPASTIDHAGMAALDLPSEGFYSCARPFLFRMDKPFQAKGFIENQILKSAGMYPVVLSTGQYSVRGCRAPAAGPTSVVALTADNVTVLPEFDRAPILNDLLWSFDAADSGGSYRTQQLYLDATSISQFQRSNERQVQSDGLRTELGAWWWTQEVSQRLFRRFAGTTGLRGGAPLLNVKAFYATLPLWVGDYCTLTHGQVPNLFTGALGITNRVFEVIDRTPDYANGSMSFKLLDTGLTGAAAAAVIGTAVIGTAVYY
jgi:hypothetical protein